MAGARRPVRSDLASRAETRSVSYLAVEGPPGSGKTVLASRLARRLGARLVTDRTFENPFLEDFYRDPERNALKTQLFFTMSRWLQQREMAQLDLFHSAIVSDYLFVKDRIHASVCLDDRELALYERLVGMMGAEPPRPDLVVYLQSDADGLVAGIRRAGRSGDRRLSREYLVAVMEAYNYYFLHYGEAPLLVVDTRRADPAADQAAFRLLLRELERPHTGMRWLSPAPDYRTGPGDD